MNKTKDPIIERTITEYLDNDYAAYGMYTIENRAIPSVIDGFKPTQRKIIYVGNRLWKGSNDKPSKVFQFAGRIAADAHYHHGDTSLNSAIIGMAQTFKNSLPLLDGIGQFGSLRSPDPGAARYISTRLNSNFRNIYKDFELLETREEEGNEIEPSYFLPVIPTVLLNGSSGIAVGFATNILNRNPIDLIDTCLKSLQGKRFKEPLPWWKGFNGEVKISEEKANGYKINGSLEILNTTTVKITELPPSMTYQKFEVLLNNLQEGGHIQYYDDNCKNEEINYTIKFQRAVLAEKIRKGYIEKMFKLEMSETENLTCLDERGKLIIFKNITELISYFVKFRLTFYSKRKEYQLSELAKQHLTLSNKARFIKDIIDGKLTVNNAPKKSIIIYLEANKFDKIDDSYNYLLNMPIYSLTKERYDDLLMQISINKKESKIIKELEPTKMYESDLLELKKKIK
jgi:DNA gyrase/topoisomerase IV subunit A